MSVILLSEPVVLIVESGDAPDACMRRPTKCSSLAAGMLLDILNFCAQLTAAVLSQWMPMHGKPIMIAAISRSLMMIVPCGFASVTRAFWISLGKVICQAMSRSLMMIVPCGLASVTRAFWISLGKVICQAMYCMFEVLGVYTPTAPS
eukprot:15366308-Ditylum_brightwellii.AAC.3